jgi:GGDEF domain-containing protein
LNRADARCHERGGHAHALLPTRYGRWVSGDAKRSVRDIAHYPLHGTWVAELFATAEAALYRAKRAGRNRVVIGKP